MTKNKTTSGTIISFNISPKGPYEGFLLQTQGQISQINFDKHLSPTITASVSTGQVVTAKVSEEAAHPAAVHPVFHLIDLATDQGKIKLSPTPPDPDEPYQFSGIIQALNYALHGEVNGAILDSGDFLHVKPEGAKALALVKGLKVKGSGKIKPMAGGRFVIEADHVNGTSIQHKPKGKKKPAAGHVR